MLTKLKGRWGEALAGSYLKKKGYKLVGMNYSCRYGEIDVIASNRKYIVFAEVKLRQSPDFAQAREFVTRSKQEKLIKAASLWLAQHPTELQPRFDVIEIYAPQGTDTVKPEIIHLKDAFQ